MPRVGFEPTIAAGERLLVPAENNFIYANWSFIKAYLPRGQQEREINSAIDGFFKHILRFTGQRTSYSPTLHGLSY